VNQARAKMVELLRDPAASANGGRAPLTSEPEPIEHSVKFYEKGDRPLELVPTRQWFVRLLDKKQQMLDKGAEVVWHPESMGIRYRDWTQNLQLDWCVSRQRFFGVPIPVWYPLDAQGRPDFARPIVAEATQLPVDPMTAVPPGFDAGRRDQPGGFAADPDVFDTWFTSSMTPQIGSHWTIDPARHRKLFPADLRPQSHEIIRTWAFYTIAKALLHENSVPWRHVAISGWVLDPDRKKMSKSKGNVVTPMPTIERFGADAARYWSGSARLGTDTAADEQVYKVGKRLVTKLFNAGKFVLQQSGELRPIENELDRAFVSALRDLVERATASFERFNHAQALADTESFFWSAFTDSYLELGKLRARGEDPAGRGSAVATLRLALDVLLRLFAPFLPYITEEVWSWAFARERGEPSIHRAPWPGEADFRGIGAPRSPHSFTRAADCWRAINKAKADAEVSMGREVERLTIAANAKTLAELEPVLADVLGAGRCRGHALRVDDSLADGLFSVQDAVFAEREPE
jgi:valyl-tRNA synthetase